MGGDVGASSSSTAGAVRESSLLWPMLTRSNYNEWVMLMQCNYEALEIWVTIDPGGDKVKRSQDRQAMAALLRSVPKEIWATLGAKKTVKEAWAAVKSMRLGADRVKEAHAQRLLQEFENISFKDGEMIDAKTIVMSMVSSISPPHLTHPSKMVWWSAVTGQLLRWQGAC